jgi:molybdenum cofactor biosynthesis enzyme MoaA
MYAPCAELEELNNLFFELTRFNCNLKCQNCYIKKSSYKELKDFLKVDKIKNILLQSRKENVKSIYLTGGEPLMHPDFNTILRMCLKFADTTVMTNGTFINEKKARFLRKIDDENEHETIYRVSLDHWEEAKNDNLRGYGNFRKVIFAVFSLIKYGFNPIISFVNYFNEDKDVIFQNFKALFEKNGFEFEPINLKIIPYFKEASEGGEWRVPYFSYKVTDCINSRIVSARGIFACPVLCNDFRARVGSDLEDYTKKVYLDTEKCAACLKHGTKAFANDWL